MTDDTISIEIDGKPLPARKGAMIIEVADQAGIHIPRFCYHAKLSIAANCRMCLVEVEKAPKPMPACATPVMDGMKVYTRSTKALSGQKSTMEFLLINHPLDCPICDQGGECELQDVAMGYGSGVSRFSERKRVVADKDIGPLIATEMTRCIHCTRCVRFGEEIAGVRELGATGRGEDMEIGTYVQHALASELSGNVIDLCPVGALTAKPSRYRARAWELIQHESVAPHDSVGSNIYLHSINRRVVRVVPRDNEDINESWLADRDRFSYTALVAEDRATKPLVRDGETLREVDWEEALEATVAGLRRVLDEHGPEAVGVLISPNATSEEMYLAQKLMRGLNVTNLDHRLRQLSDDGTEAPVFPWLGQSLADLENLDAALLIGSNIRMDLPLAGHRIRKAAMKGARVAFLNGYDYDFRFEVSHKLIVTPQDWVRELASVARAVAEEQQSTDAPEGVTKAPIESHHQALARDLIAGERATLLLGAQAMNHPQAAALRRLAAWIASTADCRLGYLPEAANSVGGWLAGAVPHRLPGGVESETSGLGASDMTVQPRRAYVLLGVEPDLDCGAPGQALESIRAADFVVTLASWTSRSTLESSSVLLPIAAPGETAGTWVNLEGRWQTVPGAVSPPGEARPAWKVLRVLGNLFDVAGFDYISAEEVVDEVFALCREVEPDNRLTEIGQVEIGEATEGFYRGGDIPIYAVDAMVRRATPLQETPLAQPASVRISRASSTACGYDGHDRVVVCQNGRDVVLPLVVDDNVPGRCAWIPGGVAGTEALGPVVGPVQLKQVD